MRAEKREERLGKIMEAAMRLFAEKSYEATSMEHIALSAGLGTGTLYNYFPSKAELLLGLISLRAAPVAEELARVAGRAGTFPRAALLEAIGLYLRSFFSYPKQLWKDFAVTCLSRGLPLFSMIGAVDEPFISCLEAIAAAVRPEPPEAREALAKNLYAVLIHSIVVYLSEERMGEEELKAELEARLGAMLER